MKNKVKKLTRFGIDTLKSTQFQKFFIIGISAFIVDFVLLSLVILIFSIPPEEHLKQTLANLFSSGVAIVFNYTIQRYWTFESKNTNVASEAGKFLGVHAFNLVVYQSILFTAINYFFPAWLAKILVTGMQIVSSFLLYKFFVFNNKVKITDEVVAEAAMQSGLN